MTIDAVTLFGLMFANLDLDRAADEVISLAREGCKGLIVTPNVDHIVRVHRDSRFREVTESALLRFADGMPLVWMSRLMKGRGLVSRVTGADLLPEVVRRSGADGVSVFFLGGDPGVANKAKDNLKAEYPDAKIIGVYSPPYGFERDEKEVQKIIEIINACAPDVLFVGLGSPKQEFWAYEHLEHLKVGPVIGVGAAFDFVAGTKSRAPHFVRSMGMEWIWRLFSEPRRLWRRYLIDDPVFLWLAIRAIYRSWL